MYYVDVYEEDRVTFAGTRDFTNKEALHAVSGSEDKE